MNNTEQELFNRVKTHLLNQGAKAETDESTHGIKMCQYHAESGLKCAVGCLITDEVYRPSMEGLDLTDRELWDALLDSGIDMGGKTLSILQKLQNVHDSNDPSDWSRAIDTVEMVLA
jgi:hypothetical protein